jgi:hypothetical protein
LGNSAAISSVEVKAIEDHPGLDPCLIAGKVYTEQDLSLFLHEDETAWTFLGA